MVNCRWKGFGARVMAESLPFMKPQLCLVSLIVSSTAAKAHGLGADWHHLNRAASLCGYTTPSRGHLAHVVTHCPRPPSKDQHLNCGRFRLRQVTAHIPQGLGEWPPYLVKVYAILKPSHISRPSLFQSTWLPPPHVFLLICLCRLSQHPLRCVT